MSATPISRVPTDVDEPDTLWGAAIEVVHAGQQLLLDRVDLLQAELTADAQKIGIAAAMMASAGAVVLLGWSILSVALGVLLTRWLPLDASLGIAGAANLLLGVLAGGLGYRQIKAPSKLDKATVDVGAELESEVSDA